MNSKKWLLKIFTVIFFVVFGVIGLIACTSLTNAFYIPATTPEGYGYLTVQNNDARQDGGGIPATGYGIREIIVNGITDKTYLRNYKWGNLPGRVPTPQDPYEIRGSKGWLEGGTQVIGDEIEWIDVKNGVEREIKRKLIPLGEYEITVVWHVRPLDTSPIGTTKHMVTVTPTSQRTLKIVFDK